MKSYTAVGHSGYVLIDEPQDETAYLFILSRNEYSAQHIYITHKILSTRILKELLRMLSMLSNDHRSYTNWPLPTSVTCLRCLLTVVPTETIIMDKCMY
jgi:hypothetical protein